MSVFDYILIGVLLVFLLIGYRKGFILQALGLIGVGAAFYLAARFHRPLAEMPLLEAIRLRSAPTALVVAFVLIFFVVAALASVIAALVGKKIKHTPVRPGDKWLGGLLGLGQGAILLGGLAVGLQEFGWPQGALIPADLQEKGDGLIARSFLVPHLTEACLAVVQLIPKGARQEIDEIWRDRTKELLSSSEGADSLKARDGTTPGLGADSGDSREKPSSPLPGDKEAPAVDPDLLTRNLVEEESSAEPAEEEETPEAGGEEPRRAEEAPRDRLIDLGTWRKLVAEESEGMSRPAAASARTEEAPEPSAWPAEEK
jgi:membrane protein required for colicin V production